MIRNKSTKINEKQQMLNNCMHAQYTKKKSSNSFCIIDNKIGSCSCQTAICESLVFFVSIIPVTTWH